jgi:hypothetical protein
MLTLIIKLFARLYVRVGMLYVRVGILYVRVGMLYVRVGMLYVRVGILYVRVGMLERGKIDTPNTPIHVRSLSDT